MVKHQISDAKVISDFNPNLVKRGKHMLNRRTIQEEQTNSKYLCPKPRLTQFYKIGAIKYQDIY